MTDNSENAQLRREQSEAPPQNPVAAYAEPVLDAEKCQLAANREDDRVTEAADKVVVDGLLTTEYERCPCCKKTDTCAGDPHLPWHRYCTACSAPYNYEDIRGSRSG